MPDSMESLPEKPPKKRQAQHEIDAFCEKYDLYSEIYGDPVERVFQAMASSAEQKDAEMVVRCADILMSYRYPRIKAIQGPQQQNGPVLNFTVNVGGEKATPVIELNPVADLLGPG